jgi:adenylate cyclase
MSGVQGTSRRLAAILAADVAGYSRLMGIDEEGTAARLKSVRADILDPTIAASHGRIVNTAGDSVLAEFGSVVDAVRCGLAIQNEMVQLNAPEPPDRRVEFRIGIHLGDVMVQADGDLLGDGVNIAARLQALVEPGRICLSEDAVHQVEGKVEANFAYAGSRTLKNIAQPVRVYTATPGTARPTRLAPEPRTRRSRSPWRLAIIFAFVLAIIFAGRFFNWFDQSTRAPVTTRLMAPAASRDPPRFSIVILPFANLSGDQGQDYFADGITENLTTDLSRMRDMFVIARNTAFTYKGKSIDAKAIGSELNVRYVLEGSVQRDQNRVRVNAQLIDTSSGAHIWADRFDADRGDLFKLEDEIVARLANSLGNELSNAEVERAVSQHTRNPDAFDLVLRAQAAVNQSQMGSDKDQNAKARALFAQALKLDPDNYDALIGSAWIDVNDVAYGHGQPGQSQRALALIDRAIALVPDQAQPHVARAMLAMVTRRTKEATDFATRAIQIGANNPNGYAALAWAQSVTGKDRDALANIDKAMALSPRDPTLGFWLYIKGSALLDLKRYDEAMATEQQAIEAHFTSWPAYLSLAVAYGLKGDKDKAGQALATARGMNPTLSIKTLRDTIDLPEPYYEGLRKAGLPEK